jgi:DNA-binding MarR family transcriptional regulator
MSKRFENHLGFWCHRAAFAFRTAFEARTKLLGLHYGEAAVLIRIHLDGPQSLAELSRNLGHSHPTVLAQVTSLEYSGYLIRESHQADRRIRTIKITGTGEKIALKLLEFADELQDLVLSQFGKAESQELMEQLKRLTDSISAAADSQSPTPRRNSPTQSQSAVKP